MWLFFFFLCSYGETLFFFLLFLKLLRKTRKRSKHGEISLRTEWIYFVRLLEEKKKCIILSLLYTASYSNHYRHHFNKFWVLAQAQQHLLYLFMNAVGTRNNSFNREMREEGTIFISFIFYFFCFRFSQWYKQTNYIAKVFGSLQKNNRKSTSSTYFDIFRCCCFFSSLTAFVNKCVKEEEEEWKL